MNNGIEKYQADLLETTMQIKYYQTAVKDFEGMLNEKVNQLMVHVETRAKIYEKIIELLNEKGEK